MSARTEFPMHGECDPLRQCALVLHSIRLEDRKWLLANLKGTLVPELEQLIDELQALGIPAEPAAAQAALTSASSPRCVPGRSDPSLRDRHQHIADPRRSRVNVLGKVLRDEPVGLIARLMRPRDAAEQKAVLAHLHAAKRRQVKQRMSATEANDLGVLALQALEEQLSIRLARAGEAPAARPAAARVIGHTLRLLRLTKVWS